MVIKWYKEEDTQVYNIGVWKLLDYVGLVIELVSRTAFWLLGCPHYMKKLSLH